MKADKRIGMIDPGIMGSAMAGKLPRAREILTPNSRSLDFSNALD